MNRVVAASVALASLALTVFCATPAHASSRATAAWRLTSVSTGTDPLDRVDVYAPVKSQVTRPALLVVHGGAWVGGYYYQSTIEQFEAVARQRGWVVGFAYYPLTAEGTPLWKVESSAMTADLRALHAYPGVGKVAVYGRSAGGQLALLTSYDHPALVSSVISSSGPTNMVEEGTNTYLHDDVVAYEGGTSGSQYYRTSPIARATADSPPTFTFGSRDDILVSSDQLNQLGQVLAAYHVEHQVYVLPGAWHMPDMETLPGTGGTAMDAALAFVAKTFAR